MKRVGWTTIGGRKVLRIDVSGLKEPASIVKVLESAKQKAGAHPPHSLLVLTIVDGKAVDRDVLEAARDLLDYNRRFVRAGAIVGLTALQRTAYRMKARGAEKKAIRPFGSLEDATAWLEEQA